jgi:hypothetical protein
LTCFVAAPWQVDSMIAWCEGRFGALTRIGHRDRNIVDLLGMATH